MFIDEKYNYKKGRVEVEGRTFQLEFWEDDFWQLPYVRVSEIIKKGTKSWLSRNQKTKEVGNVIGYGWIDGDRLEWGLKRIGEYLQNEKDKIRESEAIEKFCDIYGVGD